MRSFGGPRGAPPAPEKALDASPEPADSPLVRCTGCGEAHRTQDYGYYRPIDGSGRPLEVVPWDDEDVHTVGDGESDVHWERIDSWQALEGG